MPTLEEEKQILFSGSTGRSNQYLHAARSFNGQDTTWESEEDTIEKVRSIFRGFHGTDTGN